MRSQKTDNYIEKVFGKPLYDKAFIDADPYSQTYGKLLTPFVNMSLWRIDKPSELHPLGVK